MIRKAEVQERLNTLVGQELTNERLHEAVFCEEKHKKMLRRLSFGTHNYIEHKVGKLPDGQAYVDVRIPGNPTTFRMGLEEKEDGKLIIQSEAKISFSYM